MQQQKNHRWEEAVEAVVVLKVAGLLLAGGAI